MKLKSSSWTVALTVALVALILGASVLTESTRLRAQSNQSPANGANSNQSKSNQTSQAALVSEYLAGMQKLRGTDLTPEARAQLEQEMAQKRAQLRDLRRQTRLARGILPFGPPPRGAKRTASPTAANGDGQKAQSVQRCETCRAIMYQVGELVNTKYIQNV